MDGSTPKPEAGSIPIVNEGQLQQGFELVVDGRDENVAMLRDHLKRR